MGTYNLSADDIADVFEAVDFVGSCEGDFTEESFLFGAEKYLHTLREEGAEIPKK